MVHHTIYQIMRRILPSAQLYHFLWGLSRKRSSSSEKIFYRFHYFHKIFLWDSFFDQSYHIFPALSRKKCSSKNESVFINFTYSFAVFIKFSYEIVFSFRWRKIRVCQVFFEAATKKIFYDESVFNKFF